MLHSTDDGAWTSINILLELVHMERYDKTWPLTGCVAYTQEPVVSDRLGQTQCSEVVYSQSADKCWSSVLRWMPLVTVMRYSR